MNTHIAVAHIFTQYYNKNKEGAGGNRLLRHIAAAKAVGLGLVKK
ncbi:hypothetical protein [Cohnella pontilimi]|nr:hypothetical protein [Cohnella pontilimi]